jgi:DNA-binding CsgD family transcriptional regulator
VELLMSKPTDSKRLLMSMTGTYKAISDPRSTSHRRNGTFPSDFGVRHPAALESILGAVQQAGTERVSKTVTVPQTMAHGAAIVNIRPAREPGWAVINKLPLDEPPPLPDPRLLQELFELTPSESAVAVALLLHDDLDSIATERGISLETVRMHVKHVLRKTGTPSQKKLTSLLTRLGGIKVTDSR